VTVDDVGLQATHALAHGSRGPTGPDEPCAGSEQLESGGFPYAGSENLDPVSSFGEKACLVVDYSVLPGCRSRAIARMQDQDPHNVRPSLLRRESVSLLPAVTTLVE
jgi:hypothetical protein